MMKAYAKVKQSDAIRDQRIAEHAGMARRIALRLARKVPGWIDREDLVATAMLGLTEAAERYDDTRGEPFIAFAEQRIRGAVLDELRRGDILSRRSRIAARKIGATIASLEQQLGRAPEDEEIAAGLGVSLEDYVNELEQLTHVSFVELDRTAIDSSATGTGDLPSTIFERKQIVGRVREALGEMQERDAQLLALYYVESFTYSEIGQVLGVSESRVCQLHTRALTRLRAAMDEADERRMRR